MEEENNVDIVIRKKPPFSSVESSSESISPPAGTITAADIGKGSKIGSVATKARASGGKTFKFLILIVLVVAIGFGAYKVFPVVTSFVLSGFGTEFQYTITATATETFITEGVEEIEIMEITGSKTARLDSPTTVKIFLYDGNTLKQSSSFQADKGDVLKLDFIFFSSGGGSYEVTKNGRKMFGDLSVNVAGIQLQYDLIVENNVERTATQSGSAKVSKNGKEKDIVEVTAIPTGEEEGELSQTTYEVTIDNPNIQGIVREGRLYVSYVEAAEEPEAEVEEAGAGEGTGEEEA